MIRAGVLTRLGIPESEYNDEPSRLIMSVPDEWQNARELHAQP